jgi:hypothetical protein
MVYLGASRTVVCLWDGRSVRVPYVLYDANLNATLLTFVVSNFQTSSPPTLPADIPSPPGLP